MAAVAALSLAVTVLAAGPEDFEVKLWPDGAPTKNGLEGRTEEMKRAGARVGNVSGTTLHMYPSGVDGWGYREDFAFKRNWTDELETWLRTF